MIVLHTLYSFPSLIKRLDLNHVYKATVTFVWLYNPVKKNILLFRTISIYTDVLSGYCYWNAITNSSIFVVRNLQHYNFASFNRTTVKI